MANYNINVKAKVDVTQLKGSIQESLNQTTIPVKPKFTPSVDDNNIKLFRNTVANYFSDKPIPVVLTNPSQDNIVEILGHINKNFIITPTLKFNAEKGSEFKTQLDAIKQAIDDFGKNSKANVSFSIDPESYKQLFQTIDNIKKEQKKISNLDISLGFNQKEKERLSNEITAIYALLKGLNNLGNSITVTEPNTDNLSSIKNKIQQYFQDNPITLSISENTEGIDLSSFSKAWKQLSAEKEKIYQESNIKIKEQEESINKELQINYEKYLAEKREAEEKENQESQQRQKEASENAKAILHNEIEEHKNVFNERINNLKEYLNYLKEENQNLKDNIDIQEKADKQYIALSEEKKQQIKDISKAEHDYRISVSYLTELYKTQSYTFEEYSKSIKETMQKATKEGLVSPELIQKTSLLLDKLYKEVQDKQEKANQKAQQERKKEEERIVKYLEDMRNKTIKEEEEKLRQQEQAWNKETQDLQEKYNKQLISTEEYIEKMDILVKQGFDNGYNKATHYSNSLEQVKKKQEEAGQSADGLGDKVNTLGSKFDNVFNSLMRYFGVTKIFDAVQSSFSKMITEVRDLDAELTEFSKVSDLSSQETEKFIDNAYKLGETVAKTGTDVITATTLFKKMGYDVSESMDFAKDALMWTNVADGMVSVEEASNMLISTMKAFGEETTSTTHIIDALNEVSNNYSTSSSALSNNLSTVAATLAASGVSLEQTIGLMTAGIEIMPDKASKVANGLKTISQRIRQVDGDTAKKLDEFLGSKGLSRYDKITGQLKSTYDILGEISGLWGELSINEKQYIGEVMAGKNQITVLNALMMNFATAINATETAMNSAGSASEENARVLDSIQGHIQRLQTSFEKLSNDLISSDLLKKIVDFGTKILNWIDNLVINRGPQLLDFIGGVGIALAGWKLATIIQQLSQFITTMGMFGSIAPGAIAAITAVGAAVIDFIQRVEKANEQFENLVEAGSKGLPKDTILEDAIKKYESLYEKKDFEGLSELQHSLKQIGIEVDLVNGEYDKELGKLREELELKQQSYLLSKQIARGEQENQSSENIIKNIVENNASAFGLDSAFINLPGMYDKKLQEAMSTIYQLDIGGNTLQSVLDNSVTTIEEKKKALDNAYKDYQERALYYQRLANKSTNQETQAFYQSQAQQMLAWAGYLDNVRISLNEQNKANVDVIDAASELVKTKLERMGVDISGYSKEQIENLKSILNEIDFGTIDVGDLPKEFQRLADIINDQDLGAGLRNLVEGEYASRMKQEAFETAQALQALEESENGASYGADNLAISFKQTGLSLSGAMSMMSDYVSQAEILSQAQEDITNSGQITAETLRKIADAGLQTYLVVDETTGSLSINTQAFYDNTAAIEDKAIAEYIAYEKSQLASQMQAIEAGEINNTTNTLNNQIGALNSNGEAALDNAEKHAQAAKLQAYTMLMIGKITVDQFHAMENAANSFSTRIDQGIAALRGYFSGVTQARTATSYGASHGSSSGGSSSGSTYSPSYSSSRTSSGSSSSTTDLWKEAFEKEYKILKHYREMELITDKEYYEALTFLNDQFFKDRVGYEEEYMKYQEEIYKGQKKLLEEQLDKTFSKAETLLKDNLEFNIISQEEYFDKLEILYRTYYTDQEELENKLYELKKQRYKYELQQLDEQIDTIEDKMSKLLKRGESLLQHQLNMNGITQEEYLNYLEQLYLAYYEDREELEEKLWEIEEGRYEDQKDKIDTTISYAIDVIDEEIERLKEQKEAIEDTNEELEEQIKLQELIDNLEKAKNKKIRVYRKGQGFVYEQDTQAVSEAQTALDEYKRELSHKKKISMIDEEIENLEKYKEKWQSITDNYTKSQNEMVAKGVLGENARQKILEDEKSYAESLGNQYVDTKDKVSDAQTGMTSDAQEGLSAREKLYTTEKLIVDSVGDQYWETRGKAKDANDAIITDLGLFIGSENDPNSLSGKIKIINDELAKIQDATLTVEINGQKYTQTVQSIEDLGLVIDGLRGKEYTQLTIEIDGEKYELSKQEIQVIHQAIDNLQGKTLIIKIDDQTKESLSDIQHTVDSLEGKILQIGIQNNISDDDINAIQTLLNKLKNKVIKVSLKDTISDTELDDIQNDIDALQGKLIQVGIDSGTYKSDLNAIQNAVDAMKGKAIPISVNDKTKTPLVDIQTAVNALKDGSIEVTANDIQTIIDDLKTAKEDIEALDGQKAELEIGWKEENGKTQLEILESSMADWQTTYTTYLAEIIDKLRTLIESQKQAGSYDISGSGGNATYQSTYSYTPQLSDKVSITKQFQEANKDNLAYLDQPFWVVGFDYNGNPQISMHGPNGAVTHAVPASALYKYGTADPSTLSYSTSSNQQSQEQSNGNNNQQSSDSNQNNQQTSSNNQQQSSSGSTNSNLKVGDTVSYRDGLYTATVTALYDDGTAQIDISGNKYYVGQNELTVISSPSSGNNNQQSSSNNQQQQESTPANGESRETSNGWQYYDASSGQWMNYVYKSDSNYTWYENPITGDVQDKTTKGSNPAPSYPSGNNNGSSSTTSDGIISGGVYYDGIYFHANGTLGTKSKVFMVNEAGIEAMVTPDGTVISAPTPGYGVIKNEYTERLTDFAADPLHFLNKEFSGYVGNYKNNQDNNQIININGNLSLPNVTNGESFVDSIKTLALQYTTRRR